VLRPRLPPPTVAHDTPLAIGLGVPVLRGIAEEGSDIAEGGKANAENRRVLGREHHLVEQVRIVAALQADLAGNSPFLSAAGWDAEVARMINSFGARIDQSDAKTIADYLNKNYGSESDAPTARLAGIESSSLEKKKRQPAPVFAFSSRRRPLVRNKEYEEFNLEGVLERRSAVR
jgi:hypothetical protein